jgi:hypothetical protein
MIVGHLSSSRKVYSMSELIAGEPSGPKRPPPATNPALPLFYKRVAVVDEAKLSNSSLKEQIGYDFARNAAFVPLIVTELFSAASTYPIVFITEPVPSVLAVLGLREAQNLFVSADGTKWDAPYIPAYVRRYPFVFLRHDNDDLTLCIDEAANALEPGRARLLFEDGKRTPVIEHALRFCVEFQRGHLATEAFMKALIEQDLLIPYQVTSTLDSGERLTATGFKVIDEARFAKLSDDVVVNWYRQGWLGYVCAHLASAGCWAQLVKRSNG